MRHLLEYNFAFNPVKGYRKQMKKFELCWGLARLGKPFFTDIILEGYRMAIDVYDLESKLAYLILDDGEGYFKPHNVDFQVTIVRLPPPDTQTSAFSLALSRRNIEKFRQRRRYARQKDER